MGFGRHSPKDEGDDGSRSVDGHALGAELHEVVRLPERPIVPGEEVLQRLLDGMLAVERRVTKQRPGQWE